MKITYDNVLEKVVNNRTISRRDKQNAIRDFLKENSGDKKPKTEDEIAIIETLKAIKKTYSLKDSDEKLRERNSRQQM